MIVGTMNKQPAEIYRASVDYAAEFLQDGETITSATVAVSDDAVTASIISDFPGTGVTLLVGGGLTGVEYLVTILADTSAGQRIESEIVVSVEEIDL